MTIFSGPTRLLRGALVSVDPSNPLRSVIVFQYNPDTLSRRLEPRVAKKEGGGSGAVDRSEAYRLEGPPQETISLTIEIDATAEGLELNPAALVSGVYPTLSALEMLLYPRSDYIILSAGLSNVGRLEIVPPEAPLTLFIWGPLRVLPVRVQNLSITEEAFDGLLNPIRARVDVSMLVLSYYDLKVTHPGYNLFLYHQIAKEILATSNVFNSVQNIGAGLKIF